jgi:sulfate permease, SulP family
VEEYPDSERAPGLLVVRFDGGLTFVTSESLVDGVENRLRDAVDPFTGVVIDFAGVNFIDSQGADHIGQLLELAERDGWTLRLARVRGDVLSVLDADGILARLGLDLVHNNVDQAVQAELDAPDAAGDR